MKTLHTPGHWQRCLGSFGPYIVAQQVNVGPDKTIAKMHYSMTPDITEEENTANVRLMASAPNMLDALQWAQSCFHNLLYAESIEERNHAYPDAEHALRRIEAAIAYAVAPTITAEQAQLATMAARNPLDEGQDETVSAPTQL